MTPVKTLYSITDAATLLGVPEHRIHYSHRAGKLDDATWTFAGRRAYSASDMRRLAEYFDVDVPEEVIEQEQEDLESNFRRYMAEKHGLGSLDDMRALETKMKQHGITPPCSASDIEKLCNSIETGTFEKAQLQ